MRLICAGLATGLVLAVLAAPAEADRYTAQRPFPLVTITGEGRVTATPDIAEVTAGVTSEAKTSADAAEANAKAMAAVVEAAAAAGIAERDIRTTRYAVEPVYRAPPRSGAQQILGYRASNLVTLRIRAVERVGDVLDRLAAAGATNIGGVRFSFSNLAKLSDEARAAAFADARRKAAIYAKAAGAHLGRAITISEQDGPPRVMAMRAAPPSESATTPVAPGEETVAVQVTVTFELLQ